jgi:hypothetical protein
MSGYLSRIVHTAASSRGRLHPLTGSIYGEPAESARAFSTQLKDEPFAIDSEESTASKTERVVVSNPSARALEEFLQNYQPLQPPTSQPDQESRANFESRFQPMHDNPTSAEAALSQRDSHSAEITPASEAPERDHASTPRVADSTGDKHASAKHIARRSEVLPPHSDQSDTVNTESSNRRAEQSSSKDRAPLFASDQTQLVAPQVLIPAQSAQKQRTPEPRTQQPSMREQRSQSKQESSIEIHIGRIEVLAVQPPAPSAPAPRRDRTTSLADYLARQNGRHA